MRHLFHSFLFILILACSQDSIILDTEVFDSNNVYDTFVLPDLTMHQSMAFYEEKAVFVTPIDDNLVCDVYDILTKEKESSIILLHEGYHVPHANVSCFGKQQYADDSLFPALYVSAWDEGRQVFVYDIYLNANGYKSRLVQIIDPAHLNKDYIGSGQMDWVVDVDHNMIYSIAYGLYNSPLIYDNNYTSICQFKLPELNSGSVIYLEDEDIICSYVLPVMTVFQDKCYFKNHIYVVAGIPDNNNLYPPRLFDINIENQSLTEHLLPFDGEPEGLCHFDGSLWLNMCSSNTIYRLDSYFN